MLAPLTLDIHNLIIDGDNLTVINDVKSLWKIPWELKRLLKMLILTLVGSVIVGFFISLERLTRRRISWLTKVIRALCSYSLSLLIVVIFSLLSSFAKYVSLAPN